MATIIKIPPKKGKPFQYPAVQVVNPGKGLNTLISETLIDDAEASDLNNVYYTESGCPTKAGGKSLWGTGLSNNPKGLGTYINTTSGARKVLVVDGTALKYTTAAGDTWTTISGVTFTTAKDTTFTQLKDDLFVWNGTDAGAVYDGTTLSQPGTIPSASYSIFYQGSHFASGTGTKTSRIYISADTTVSNGHRVFTVVAGAAGNPPTPNNSTDVPGASTFNASTAQLVDITPGDGDKITGLAKFKDVLIIFKERSIYQFTFDSTGKPVITNLVNYLGAISHKSIDNVENDVYYLSRNGWHKLGYEANFFSVIRTNIISQRIKPLFDTINANNFVKVSSIYFPYRFYSSIPTSTSAFNDTTVTYDKRYDAWSKVDFIHANAYTVYIDSSNVQHLLFADDNDTKVYEITPTTYSDNGSAISAYWQSKAFDGGELDLYKRWIDLTVYFRQITGTIKITIFADNSQIVHSSTITSGQVAGGIGSYQWGANQWGGTPDTTAVSADTTATSNIPYRIRINTTSRTLKFKVQSDNLNETFVLLGFRLTYRPYSHFKFPSALKIQ